MKILFIWDEVAVNPVSLYEATGEMAALALRCQDQYINSAELPEDAAVHELHAKVFYGNEMPPHPEFQKVDPAEARGPYDRVVIAGFLP